MGLRECVAQVSMLGEIDLRMKPTLWIRELEKVWVLDAMAKLLDQPTLKPSLSLSHLVRQPIHFPLI